MVGDGGNMTRGDKVTAARGGGSGFVSETFVVHASGHSHHNLYNCCQHKRLQIYISARTIQVSFGSQTCQKFTHLFCEMVHLKYTPLPLEVDRYVDIL